MEPEIQTNRLSLEEKMILMEKLWADLTSQHKISPTLWHEDVLKKREQNLKNGQDEWVDWEQEKDNLRNKFQ